MTGYLIVDAGMRELRSTRRMHNCARMIAASFLVKDLLINWRRGERYFRHWPRFSALLSDLQPGCPVTAVRPIGGIHPPVGPELSALADKSIHEPSSLAPLQRAATGVWIDETYPAPIIDHAFARQRTLQAYQLALTSTIDPNEDKAP